MEAPQLCIESSNEQRVKGLTSDIVIKTTTGASLYVCLKQSGVAVDDANARLEEWICIDKTP